MFTVAQWNTLADSLCDESFSAVPAELRVWSHRKQLISNLLPSEYDIICLQEVDHYEDFFKDIFEKCGYTAQYAPNTNGSPCVKMASNNGPDGVVIAAKSSKFNFAASKVLEVPSAHGAVKVVLMAHLKHLDTSRSVFVASLHLKANVIYDAVRKDQIDFILPHFQKFIEEHDTDSDNSAVLLLGDFNAEPDEACIVKVKETMSSAYDLTDKSNIYSTAKLRDGTLRKRWIDYIFYKALTCKQQKELPRIEDLAPNYLPSESFPSDHLLLSAEFSLQ